MIQQTVAPDIFQKNEGTSAGAFERRLMEGMKFVVVLLAPVLASASILPDAIGPFHRTGAKALKLQDPAIWDEYGLKDSESADYVDGERKFTADAWQFADSTGAMAAFEWQRPADADPSQVARLAVRTRHGLMIADGNYLLIFQGYKPVSEELDAVLNALYNVDGSPLPTLTGFFPKQELIPNSERYILGPASLAKFDPGIPPSVAAFHLGSEAQLGTFPAGPKGRTMTLAVFNYPTPQIAMQELQGFNKLPGAVAKRTGPLIAVILSPPDADAAERLLAHVRWDAQVTLDERVPGAADNPANMLIAIFTLAGILMAFCLIAGLFVGGFRTLILGRRKGVDAEPMILLHLEERLRAP